MLHGLGEPHTRGSRRLGARSLQTASPHTTTSPASHGGGWWEAAGPNGLPGPSLCRTRDTVPQAGLGQVARWRRVPTQENPLLGRGLTEDHRVWALRPWRPLSLPVLEDTGNDTCCPGPRVPQVALGWSPGHSSLLGFVSFRCVVLSEFFPVTS